MVEIHPTENLVYKRHLPGSLWLLQRLPWWVILFMGPLSTTGVVWLLRVTFEERFYDYSRASFPGDFILFVYLFCVKQLSEKEELPRNFFFEKTWHWVTFLDAFIVTGGMYGFALSQGRDKARFTLLPAKLYHFFVQLVLSYAIPSSFPVVVAKNKPLRYLAVVCLALYVSLLVYDIAKGNLGQHMQ